MGTIAALKQRYKYLYLKDILNFYELDENLKASKKDQAKRLPRGAAGVASGNPAHMLDAAEYIKLAWDAISDTTIKNAFNKAELVTLKGRAHEEVDMMADLLCSFKALNNPIDESTLNEFVPVDDENSEEFYMRFWMTSMRRWKVYKQQMIMKMKTYTLWSNLAHIVQHQQETMSLFVGLHTYTIKFLKLRISCCVPMCKFKQEITIMS